MNKALIISLLVLVFVSCKKEEPFVLQDNFSFAKQPEDILKAYSTGYFKVETTVSGPASMPSLQDTVPMNNFYMRITENSLEWTDSSGTKTYSMKWVYDVEKETQIFYRMDLTGMVGGESDNDNFDLRPKEMKNGYLVLYNSWYSGTWYFLKRIKE
jgi:hypothetical protein